MKPKPLPSRELVMRLLRYTPQGLIWRHRPEARIQWNARFAGKIAGSLHPDGHVFICIGEKGERTVNHKAHRLVWLIKRGEPVPDEIDHRDRVRSHNWIGNLRDATRAQNSYNMGLRSDNKTGVKGVSYLTRDNRFRVTVNSRPYGTFKTLEEAVAVRNRIAKRLHGKFVNETTI